MHGKQYRKERGNGSHFRSRSTLYVRVCNVEQARERLTIALRANNARKR